MFEDDTSVTSLHALGTNLTALSSPRREPGVGEPRVAGSRATVRWLANYSSLAREPRVAGSRATVRWLANYSSLAREPRVAGSRATVRWVTGSRTTGRWLASNSSLAREYANALTPQSARTPNKSVTRSGSKDTAQHVKPSHSEHNPHSHVYSQLQALWQFCVNTGI
ncbi:unnamed protein product [Lampetra planeri]